jgi:phosphohistidine phosphatase
MEVFLVRHGDAIARDGTSDAFRPLTEKGRRRFRKTARSFARLGCEVELILTSPLVRAVQTAEILAGEVPHGDVDVLEQLDPRFDAQELLRALRKRANGSGSVALVGHEPQISSVLAALAGVDAETLRVKKGAIVRLQVREPTQRGSASAVWSLKPKSKMVKKGLPLAKTDADEVKTDGRRTKKKLKRSASRRSAEKHVPTARETAEAEGSSDAVLGAGAEDATEHTAARADDGETSSTRTDPTTRGSGSPVAPLT